MSRVCSLVCTDTMHARYTGNTLSEYKYALLIGPSHMLGRLLHIFLYI